MILIGSYSIAMIMFSNISVTTVFYIYCKDNNHGEISEEEFGNLWKFK